MEEHRADDLTRIHLAVSRDARTLGDGTGDLVGVGWISALVRGSTRGVRSAMAAYVGALRSAK